MFERMFDLFLHAKTGLIAGIFVLGTTGALVTATVQNGVTTITITEAGPSTSAANLTLTSPSPSASPTASPTATATAAANTALISSSTQTRETGTTSTTCDATQAHAAADAVKEVNSAFSQYHTDLAHSRKDAKGDSARSIIENADKALKEIRQNAVKAIHATVKCGDEKDDEDANTQDKTENDDEDQNDDNDDSKKSPEKSSAGNFVVVLFNNLFGKHNTTGTTTTNTTLNTMPTTTVTTLGDDVKKIADDAVAAMKVVFDTAKSDLGKLPAATPKPTKSPRSSSPDTKGKSQNHGSGDNGNGKKDD